MKVAKDLTGQKFNRLTVVRRIPTERSKAGRLRVRWLCMCDCGRSTSVEAGALKSGQVASCGCLRVESTIRKGVSHRKNPERTLAQTPGYYGWVSMKSRCENPKHHAYKNYGGRGITVCGAWQDFNIFRKDMGDPPKGMTLERMDNNKGYYKENCIWASKVAQAHNRRTNKLNKEVACKIRELHASGKYTIEELSRRFNTVISNISNIIHNRRWCTYA